MIAPSPRGEKGKSYRDLSDPVSAGGCSSSALSILSTSSSSGLIRASLRRGVG